MTDLYDPKTEILQIILTKHELDAKLPRVGAVMRVESDAPEQHLFVASAVIIEPGGRSRLGPRLGFYKRARAEKWVVQTYPQLVRLAPHHTDDPSILAVWT